jgi:Protein kinase domain
VEELRPGDPQQIGSYRLLGLLGSGGMGQVFLGRSPGGRPVAVKVIRPELADSPDFRRRFAREVAAARRVGGVFTAPVVDADPDAPQPWLVTAYVNGPSLADHVKNNGAMPESDVMRLGCALAEGLAAIHAAGIVHRDLKPSNVLLASDGPRIIDFGISRATEATSLTQSGLVVGSPGFMSPEQAEGREVNAASDVFSLGAVLAFIATGTGPFGTGAASAMLYRVVHADPDLTGVSGGLRDVVLACLRKNPAERPTPAGLLTMLVSLGNGQPLPARLLGTRSTPAERAGSGYPPAEVPDRRTAQPDGVVPVAAVAVQDPVLSANISRHRRRRFWIALCAAVALAGGAGVALTSDNFGTHKPAGTQASGARQIAHGRRRPSAVVAAYFGAINAHNWGKVWQLGGKNLSPSYARMVAGFRDTGRDVVTRMTTDGDAVTVRIRSYETTGAMQVYVLSYTVSGDVIAGGHQTLISAQTACPHIQYGADDTAGPLFCTDGQPNPPVLAYYRTLHLQVLRLGPDVTPAQVLQAICTDVHQHSTYPIETAAYNLAQKINGWSFGVSPPQEMLNGACG